MNALTSLLSLLSPFSSSSSPQHGYTLPSILQIRRTLSHLLPPELITLILDHAEIWLCTSASRQDSVAVMAHPHVDNDAGMYYLVSKAIPKSVKVYGEDVKVKVRRVRWRVRSHDQGWGGEEGLKGTYQSSYTWFEACILKPPSSSYELPKRTLSISDINYTAFDSSISFAPSSPPTFAPGYELPNPHPSSESQGSRWHIQSNIHVSSTTQDHSISWSWDDPYHASSLSERERKGQGSGERFLEALEGVGRYDGSEGDEGGRESWDFGESYVPGMAELRV